MIMYREIKAGDVRWFENFDDAHEYLAGLAEPNADQATQQLDKKMGMKTPEQANDN